MKVNIIISIILIVVLGFQSVLPMKAQTANILTFEKAELLIPNGDNVSEKSVRLIFLEDSLQIESKGKEMIIKTFKYSDIKDAEYSYSKNPRWKTGLGLGAVSLLFPPLLLIAIPVGFSKHRRHWLTIRTENDFAVLKLSKSNRKLILPAFETKTGVDIKGRGENK
jgi:hypothetical protein